MPVSVFVLIKLLKSDADVVNRDVIECVLCEVCEEEEEDCEVCKEEGEEDKEEDKEEEHYNAAINEVKRPRIASRSLEGCERLRVSDSVSEGVM